MNADLNSGSWEAETNGGENSLRINGDRIEIRSKLNGEKKVLRFSVSELKYIEFYSNSGKVKFRKPGKFLAFTYEGEDEQREQFVAVLKKITEGKATENVSQNGFLNNAIEAGAVMGIFALICNALLSGALLWLEDPSNTPGVVGGRIARGIAGLAHGMGWTGIIIMNVVLFSTWVFFTWLGARSDHQIHRLQLK
ncbi:MAG: hypothetical protein AAF483_08670 [Planctomycetota bacterium]